MRISIRMGGVRSKVFNNPICADLHCEAQFCALMAQNRPLRSAQERGQWRNYQTRFEAISDIRDYIVMHYNEKRLLSFLGYVSPNA